MYLLLREGHSMSHAAEVLDKDISTIHYHAQDLEEQSALVRVEGTRNPVLFDRGPFAIVFERDHDLENSLERPAQSAAAEPPADQEQNGVRIHGEVHRVDVVEPPSGEVPWSAEWTANGVPNKALRTEIEGVPVRFWMVGEGTLMVQLGEQWAADPGTIAAIQEQRAEVASKAARWFARAFDASLQGHVTAVKETEMGVEVPGLEADLEGAAEGSVWVDESPGIGRPELETDDPSIAEAVAGLPDQQRELAAWKQEMTERLANIETGMDGNQEIMEQVVRLLEKQEQTNRLITEALVEIADQDDEDNDAGDRDVPPPPDRDPGVL